MQRDHGLAGARASPHTGRPVVVGVGDAALRRVEVDHPLLDRGVEQPLDLRSAAHLDELCLAPGGGKTPAQLRLLDREVIELWHPAGGKGVEVVLLSLPEVGEQERQVGIAGALCDRRRYVDGRRQHAQKRDEVLIHALDPQEHRVLEWAEAVLDDGGCSPRDARRRTGQRRGGRGRTLGLDDRDATDPPCEADLRQAFVDVASRSDRGDEEVVAGAEEDRPPVSGADAIGAVAVFELPDVEARRRPERLLSEPRCELHQVLGDLGRRHVVRARKCPLGQVDAHDRSATSGTGPRPPSGAGRAARGRWQAPRRG